MFSPLQRVIGYLFKSRLAPAPLKPPPPLIDGAEVLWWAWAGTDPFGVVPLADGDRVEGHIPIYGFAICRYSSGRLYRFSCDENWETVNDAPQDDEEEAKADHPLNYEAARARVRWHRYRE